MLGVAVDATADGGVVDEVEVDVVDDVVDACNEARVAVDPAKAVAGMVGDDVDDVVEGSADSFEWDELASLSLRSRSTFCLNRWFDSSF